MAKEEKQDEAPAELSPEELAEKKRKRKRLLIVGVSVLLLIGGSVGAFFMMAGGGDKEMAAKPGEESSEEVADEESSDAESAEGDSAEGEQAEGDSAEGEGAEGEQVAEGESTSDTGLDIGCSYTFEPFHLNLGNPLENRYIRLGIAMEYGCGEDQKTELDRRVPQLRDAIIEETSLMTRDYLLGPKGKPTLRRKILKRVNQYMTNKVEDVFITDILIE